MPDFFNENFVINIIHLSILLIYSNIYYTIYSRFGICEVPTFWEIKVLQRKNSLTEKHYSSLENMCIDFIESMRPGG